MLQSVAKSADEAGSRRNIRERARSRSSVKYLRALTTMTAVAALMIFQRSVHAGPTGGSVVAGSAGISQAGNTTNINQSSQSAVINWQSFSIGRKETVNFNQPNSSAVALNRVIGNEQSVIAGALNANGRVFIVNSAGVLFSKSAQVNVGGLVASTLDISNEDFMAGKYRFSGTSTASVVNRGTIRAHGGGYVALLGNKVINNGVIAARLGTVAMASGEAMTLNFDGNSLVDVTIDKGTLNALVANKRAIKADGGTVIMTAKAADEVLSAQVNNTGIVQARTIASLRGGSTGKVHIGKIKILADGGTANIAGKLDASAPKGGDGGFIETSGDKVQIADSAVITTKAATGKNGTWLIDPYNITIMSAADANSAYNSGTFTGTGSPSIINVLTLQNALANNNVVISTGATGSPGTDAGDINVNTAVTWAADTILTLNALNSININAPITATGAHAGLVLNYGGYATTSSAAAGTDYHIDMSKGGAVTLSGLSATLKINGVDYGLIHSLAELASQTALDPTKSYALAQNLDAATDASMSYNVSGPVIMALTGNLAGLGHTISGLRLTEDPSLGSPTSLIGYFGTLDGVTAVPTAQVRDIGLINTTIVAPGGNSGALVGWNYGIVSNAYAAGVSVSGGATLGGLVGENESVGVVSNSYTSAANISGSLIVGGLVGGNKGTVKYSYTTNATVAGTGVDTGGAVGFNYTGATIDGSYATNVLVSGPTSVGGLVGASFGTISNSYATGAVSSSFANASSIGGLVGNVSGTLSNSHANVIVSVTNSGHAIGGLAGTAGSAAMITNSYAEGSVTAANSYSVGGLIGDNSAWVLDDTHATGAVIVNATTSGGYNVGGLIGSSSANETINRAYATGSVTVTGAAAGSAIGGLIGSSGGGSTVTDSYAMGDVTAASSTAVGGLIGNGGGSKIINSYATGNVIGKSVVGGLVGNFNSTGFSSGSGGLIQGSHATGDVTATDPSVGNAGGLVGTNGASANAATTTIIDSYATGNVTGASNIGGLVGSNQIGGKITNSTASGNVTSSTDSHVDQLLGNNQSGNPNAVSNSRGTGFVSTPASRALAAAQVEAARLAALAEAARLQALAEEARRQAEAKAAQQALAERVTQTGSVIANASSTVTASNSPNMTGSAANGASNMASSQVDSHIEYDNRSSNNGDNNRRRTASNGSRPRGGNLGATIRSIEINGQRFNLRGGNGPTNNNTNEPGQ
ncbi:filamentous hemagglutinin N-terminal domain-containing protein [Microbacteriaceae bacterium K1510]|nr:filamentous hemagglutinin N-terminal domain-containing protein [Microbacteriaceae bacterium K1510]